MGNNDRVEMENEIRFPFYIDDKVEILFKEYVLLMAYNIDFEGTQKILYI